MHRKIIVAALLLASVILAGCSTWGEATRPGNPVAPLNPTVIPSPPF